MNQLLLHVHVHYTHPLSQYTYFYTCMHTYTCPLVLHVHVHYTHPLLHIHVHTHVYFYICMHTYTPISFTCTCTLYTPIIAIHTVHVNKKFPNLPVTEQNSNSTATVQQQYSTIPYRLCACALTNYSRLWAWCE